MTGENARRLRDAAQEAEDQAMRRAAEGELQHLQGKPLDLSDDSPAWFLNRMLKREGFSHPLIERGKEVDQVQGDVDRIARSLRNAHARLTDAGYVGTVDQVRGFNIMRMHGLGEYREALGRLNRAIMFHNLGVPESLHRRPVLIEDAIERLAEEVPEIPEPVTPPRRTLRQRLVSRLRRT